MSPAAPAPAPAVPPARSRRRRRWRWVAASALFAATGFGAALLAPPVQAWAVKRLVALQPGWQLEAERLGLGLRGLEARGLEFAMPGFSAKSAPVSVRVAPARFFRRELHVERVSIEQLRLDITPAQLASSEDPFPGLLAELELPLRWSISEAVVDAHVAVHDAGAALVAGDLQLRGGGIGPAQTGTFDYELAAASALLPPGPQNKIHSRGTLRVVQNAAHVIERIELEGDLRLPAYGLLMLPAGSLKLVVAATPAGERYALTLALGEAGALTFTGELDRTAARLAGRVSFRGDQRLAASIAGERLPAVTLDGTADIALDLRTYDADVTLSSEFAAHDWARLAPELSSLESLAGRLEAAVQLRNHAPLLTRAAATLRGTQSAFAASAALTGPVPLATRPAGSAPLATFAFEHAPVTWANPLLGESLQLTSGEIAGAWSVALAAGDALTLTPIRPLVAGSLTFSGEKLPPLLPLTVRAQPRLSLSAEGATLALEELIVSSEANDRVALALTADYAFASGRAHTAGTLHGELPTLLAGADQPLPFVAQARWDATFQDDVLRLDAFEGTLRRSAAATPMLAVALQHPLAITTDAALRADPQQDLLKLAVNGLPLTWLSRWLPSDIAFAGNWAEGESVLRHASATAGSEFVFVTRLPWTFDDLRLAVGGKEFFSGTTTFAPDFEVGPARQAAHVLLLRTQHADGSELSGEARFAWEPAAKKFAAELALDALLPALPHSEETFGVVTASLRAKAATAQESVAIVEQLRAEVGNAVGPLLTAEAPEPFLFAQKPTGEVIFKASTPLQVRIAPLPLAWMRPWLPAGVAVEGTLETGEFALHLEPQHFRLRPIVPFRVRDFALSREGHDAVRAAALTLHPGADVLLIHQLRPTFQLVYTGRAHATDGGLMIGAERAGEFELGFGFMGNDQSVLPRSIDLQARVDLAPLGRVPALAAGGLPATGTFVARLNGDLLGSEPLEFWARLDGLPSAPPLEIAAHGKAHRQTRSFDFDVAAKLLGADRPSDVAFRVTLAPAEGTLTFDSALKSAFLDLDDGVAIASAFRRANPTTTLRPTATKPETIGAQAAAPPPAVAPREKAAQPFWSVLRGRFDLDLQTVRWEPYRLDGLRGRLEVKERTLTFDDLAGRMFAGRWGGGLRIDFDPGAGRHEATGGFRIEQFETARAVQTVFPNEFGSFDARINLDASLRSDGEDLWALLARAEGEFTVEGERGTLRLTHPAAGTASTLLVLGGTVAFSPELRALGRLLKKFAEMPVDALRVSGARDAAGNIVLREFAMDSAQARLRGHGAVPAVDGVPLMGRKLDLALELQARDEVAVILSGMKLLEPKPGADGFRRMRQPFALAGEVGKPDPSPLYDLLARAVAGSKGTWGLIMRKVDAELRKQQAKSAKQGTTPRSADAAEKLK